jgi:hypothetical protein
MAKNLPYGKIIAILILPMCLLLSCAKEYTDLKNKPKEGQTKLEILELLGKPNRIETIVKQSDLPVFGPLMGVWDKLPIGTQLEEFTYVFSDGYLSIYFKNEVEGAYLVAFTPKGVVY